jgi:hypothetical protein
LTPGHVTLGTLGPLQCDDSWRNLHIRQARSPEQKEARTTSQSRERRGVGLFCQDEVISIAALGFPSRGSSTPISGPSMDPQSYHPFLETPPRCRHCGNETTAKGTKWHNLNGNGGRSFYKCTNEDCRGKKRFAYFRDMRGIHLSNPVCYCSGYPLSRLQVAGEKDRQIVPRAFHYVCAVGGCGFFDYYWDDMGVEIVTYRPRRLSVTEMQDIGV